MVEFANVPEPLLADLLKYVKYRKEHLRFYQSLSDVRAELLRNITDQIQPIDAYPKGRHFLTDDDYVSVLRDMFNLSVVLDDMEQTGGVSHGHRAPYYNQYSRLYRLLASKAKETS